MSDVTAWALRTAVGGGAVLLIGWWLASRQRLPARRQRLAEVALAAALLVPLLALMPGWLPVPVGVAAPAPRPPELAEAPEAEGPVAELWVPDVEEAAAPEPEPAPVAAAEGPSWATLLLWGYAALSAAVLARWLLACWVIHRVLRGARPAPPAVQALFDELRGGRRWRLAVSDRTAVPFSVGLWRPAVVLPGRLVEAGTAEEVEWALRHEATHLLRQDTRTWWLVALGQVVYFYLPWFWWLRRQVRLAQEMVADARAAPEGLAADYAQFLLSWAAGPPAGATGVSGAGSDLYRRIAMLLQDRSAALGGCPRRWLMGVGAGLVALAVLAAGARPQARADDEPEKKAPPKKQAEPKKKAAPGLDPLKELEEALKGLDEQGMKDLRKKMDELRQRMEELRKHMPVPPVPPLAPLPGQGLGGAWVFPNTGQGLFFGGREGRLGVQVERPSATLVEQLDLPKGQGLVLREVGANSAAGKAGLKAHDVLLELGGKPVPNTHEGLSKLLEGIKAGAATDAVVLRKGKKETVKGLTLPEARAAGRGFGQGGALAPLARRGGDSISLSRNNDSFTAAQTRGGVSLAVKGKIVEGKAVPSEISLDDGTGKKTYDSVEKVPAEHQAMVKKLLEMSASGRAETGGR